MHWVDRSPEPPGLDDIRVTLTPDWVAHYRGHVEDRPSDDRWRDFLDELRSRFHGICGYCEEQIAPGGVDHFRPKSKFPEIVYEWGNWVFACNSCNHAKNDRWPPGGYVDPCECSCQDRPENFFDFDLDTGDIISKPGLTEQQHRKAWQTIDDLALNDMGHRNNRRARIREVRMFLEFLDETPAPDIERFVMSRADRSSELSSVTRAVFAESDYSVEPD